MLRARPILIWRAVLGMAALACLLLAPRLSWASATLQCAEASEPVFASLPSSFMTSPLAAPLEDDEPADDIDVAGAPMSLSEGASAVAPRPIDAPSDARIEAVKRCQDSADNDVAQAPHDDAPLPEPSSVMAAALPAPIALPVLEPREEDLFDRTDGVPPSGVRRTVDRPPRA